MRVEKKKLANAEKSECVGEVQSQRLLGEKEAELGQKCKLVADFARFGVLRSQHLPSRQLTPVSCCTYRETSSSVKTSLYPTLPYRHRYSQIQHPRRRRRGETARGGRQPSVCTPHVDGAKKARSQKKNKKKNLQGNALLGPRDPPPRDLNTSSNKHTLPELPTRTRKEAQRNRRIDRSID